MTVFYYTATGNSLSVAKKIGGSLISIPQIINAENQHYKDDVIGIVFPIYWWAPPIMVRRFMEKAKFDADYIFAIGTYGSISAGAMVSLYSYAKKNGYCFDYINQICMLDNYLPVFDMIAQEKKLPKRRIPENIAKIVADIKSQRHVKPVAFPWKLIMTSVMGKRFRPNNNAKDYIIDEKCNKCGICSKVCPAANIEITDIVNFNNQCEGCLACLHLCPQNATHIKNEKNERRWRNPDVTVDDIIEANEQ